MEASNETGQLAAALASAQGAFLPAIKAQENPFFKSKYLDLAGAIHSVREALSKNDLAVVQSVIVLEAGDEKIGTFLETRLLHKSGEWIAGIVPYAPVKRDPQAVGSALTYARRYGLCALVGIAQEDDDGEAGMGRGGRKSTEPEKVADEWGQGQGKTVANKAKGREPWEDRADEIRDMLGRCASLEDVQAIWKDAQQHIKHMPENVRDDLIAVKDEAKARVEAPVDTVLDAG